MQDLMLVDFKFKDTLIHLFFYLFSLFSYLKISPQGFPCKHKGKWGGGGGADLGFTTSPRVKIHHNSSLAILNYLSFLFFLCPLVNSNIPL